MAALGVFQSGAHRIDHLQARFLETGGVGPLPDSIGERGEVAEGARRYDVGLAEFTGRIAGAQPSPPAVRRRGTGRDETLRCRAAQRFACLPQGRIPFSRDLLVGFELEMTARLDKEERSLQRAGAVGA